MAKNKKRQKKLLEKIQETKKNNNKEKNIRINPYQKLEKLNQKLKNNGKMKIKQNLIFSFKKCNMQKIK